MIVRRYQRQAALALFVRFADPRSSKTNLGARRQSRFAVRSEDEKQWSYSTQLVIEKWRL